MQVSITKWGCYYLNNKRKIEIKESYNYSTNQMVSRVAQMQTVQAEALELFKRKNADYGDSFATYGPVGVLVRLGDKISRLSHITNCGVTLVNTESLRDTLVDLHNYAAMAVMLIDETKEDTKVVNKLLERVKAGEREKNWIIDTGVQENTIIS